MEIVKGEIGISPIDDLRTSQAKGIEQQLTTFLRGKGCIIDCIEKELDYNGDVEYLIIRFYCANYLIVELKESDDLYCYGKDGELTVDYSFESINDILRDDSIFISDEVSSMLEVEMEQLDKVQTIINKIVEKLLPDMDKCRSNERVVDYLNNVYTLLGSIKDHLNR